MPRIAGVDIPQEKRTEIALTYIIGIGRSNVKKILLSAGVNPDTRARDLTTEEIARLQKVIDTYPTEGKIRSQVRENVQRLKRIGCFRGLRHSQNLPVRGQRTRTNARTKRGKRRTIGAMKKRDLSKFKTAVERKSEEK